MSTRPKYRLTAGLVLIWLGIATASRPLQADPLDRQVAEWVILMGGSVRLEGQGERIREVSELPAADFHLELVGPRRHEHPAPRFAAADRPDASEDPESARAHVEPQLRGDHRLQPRPAAHRGHQHARGAHLQLHLPGVDQVQRRWVEGDRPAGGQPQAAEPGGHSGARPPPRPVHESRVARPGLLPGERRRSEADARHDQAAAGSCCAMRDQRRGPAAPQRPARRRASRPGRHEDHRCRSRPPARHDEAAQAEPAGHRSDGRRDPAPGGHDRSGGVEPLRDEDHQRRRGDAQGPEESAAPSTCGTRGLRAPAWMACRPPCPDAA